MRQVAIAVAALSVLAFPVAAGAAPAGQLFAQVGGAAPAVGGNGQSGNPGISPDHPVPTNPETSGAASGTTPMATPHHRRHRRHRTHHMTPSKPSSDSMPSTPAPSAEPSSNSSTPSPNSGK